MNNAIAEAEPSINQRLGHYTLTREIGRGGHGVVYAAHHENQPGETVAVKVIEDTGNLDTLLVEPELLSKLQHPNIVGLKDYFLHAGKLVLVLEYINGGDLQDLLKQRGRLTPLEVKEFLVQVAGALAYAHANNIIHRDIKLGNILVAGDEQNRRYVLTDFGISRMAEGIQTAKRVAGTYYFMAPEQLRGRPSEQSDLWALGVTAYSLLTGVRPFEADTQEDLAKKIYYSNPQVLSNIVSDIDPDLERIILHLIEKQLIDRTTSADELLNELSKSAKSVPQKHILPRENAGGSTRNVPSWEQGNIREIKKSMCLFWVFLFLALLPQGLFGYAMLIGGAFLFFLGHEQKRTTRFTWYVLGGLALMLIGNIAILIFWVAVGTILFVGAQAQGTQITEENLTAAIGGLSAVAWVITIPCVIVALHYLAKARRLQRDTLLLKALRTGLHTGEELIMLLKNLVDVHLGDINIHQKYVETLLLSGRLKEAIVESKRIIEIDPYNTGATLFLANGYFETGLYRECMEVCNGYLAVSGYSFEFSDLREECQRIMRNNHEV